jgi:hypothetical protein
MALVIGEARGADFLETLADDGAVVRWRHRRHYGLHWRQIDGGAAITARDRATARLVCMGGLYARPDGLAEAWFAAGAGFEANRVAALRRLRAFLDILGGAAAPMLAVAYVGDGGVAGARLAGWLGFREAGPEETPLGLMRRFERRFP